MKFALSFSLIAFSFLISSGTTHVQSENVQHLKTEEVFLVTFECNSCTKRNKFYIDGPEEHTFKAAKFPLKIKLKPGEYEMTYWQNRVQQIHLPFYVSSDSENVIVVKD